MTTIVKAADAAQFLSLLPHMLGFHPRESLVLVPFDGATSLGAMRYDLPDDAADVDRVAATVVGMVCRVSRADAVAIAVWSEDPDVRQGFVQAVEHRADACGLSVVDTLWSTPTEWGRYGEGERHPVADETSPFLPVAADQSAGAELPPATEADRTALATALTALGDAVRVVCGPEAAGASTGAADRRIDPQALAAACALDDLPTLFEGALAWDAASPAPYDGATLAWCLSRPALRDIALVQWCRGLSAGDEALDAQLRWEDGEEYPAHIAMQMWGEGDRPDARRLEKALALVRRIAATAPEESTAGPLATAAWISWALGRSTHAAAYAQGACEAEPEHGLAEIVLSFVAAGHLPDWAFRRG